MSAKKILCLSLALLLVLSLAACSPSSSTPPTDNPASNNPSSNPSNNPSGDPAPNDEEPTLDNTPHALYDPLGKYEPAIEVTTVHTYNDGPFWFPEGEELGNDVYTKRYEEQLGIKYTYKWTAPGSQSAEKKATMFVSGDLPDFMTVNRNEFAQLYAAGQLEDLTVPLAEYASDYTRQFLTGEYQMLRDYATMDGRVYGITNGLTYQDGGEMIWIRKDWLDKLSLEVPKTVADLENIMEQFKKHNPSGLSEDESFPISIGGADQNQWSYTMQVAFYNMFGSYPSGWHQISDGTLNHGLFGAEFRDNTRTALEKANEYFNKGYIESDFTTKSGNMSYQDIYNGKNGILFGELWSAYWPLIMHRDTDPEADWIAVPIVNNGSQQGMVARDAAQCVGIIVARKGVEHPEAIVKMTNLFHDLNNNPDTMEFEKFNTAMDGNQLLHVYPMYIYNPSFNYDAYLEISAAQASGDFDGLCDGYKMLYEQGINFELGLEGGDWAAARSYLAGNTALAVCESYVKNKDIMFREYTGDPTEHMLDNEPTVKKMFDVMAANVITGNSSISAFDDFIKSWDEIYGNTATQEVNDWFVANGSNSFQSRLGK